MVMDKEIRLLLIQRWFGDMISDEFEAYMARHYSCLEEVWSVPPPILWLWGRDDFRQYIDGTFYTPENEKLRHLRENCLELMHTADEQHRAGCLKVNEVRAIYDTVFSLQDTS